VLQLLLLLLLLLIKASGVKGLLVLLMLLTTAHLLRFERFQLLLGLQQAASAPQVSSACCRERDTQHVAGVAASKQGYTEMPVTYWTVYPKGGPHSLLTVEAAVVLRTAGSEADAYWLGRKSLRLSRPECCLIVF
jgi:hypothetical protein